MAALTLHQLSGRPEQDRGISRPFQDTTCYSACSQLRVLTLLEHRAAGGMALGVATAVAVGLQVKNHSSDGHGAHDRPADDDLPRGTRAKRLQDRKLLNGPSTTKRSRKVNPRGSLHRPWIAFDAHEAV